MLSHIHAINPKKTILSKRGIGFARRLFPARTFRRMGIIVIRKRSDSSHKKPNKE
jgi:hypothetical protein